MSADACRGRFYIYVGSRPHDFRDLAKPRPADFCKQPPLLDLTSPTSQKHDFNPLYDFPTQNRTHNRHVVCLGRDVRIRIRR